MSEPMFNELIHQPHRLRICVLLAGVEEMAFRTLCEELGVSMPTLSKQLKMLAEAGYVSTAKAFPQGRPATWAKLTPEGRRALTDHLAALHALTAHLA